MNLENIKWTKVSGSIDWWKPEHEGDSLTGVVIDKRDVNDHPVWFVETSDGVRGTPSHQVLVNAMQNVGVGSVVQVVFTGREKNDKGSPTYMYDVFVGQPIEGGD